jgi:hypothetical protein
VGLTLQEQLSSLPIPRLTTVLRVNFDLKDGSAAFDHATRMVEEWWNKKAEPYDVCIAPSTTTLSFARDGFRIEFARSEEAFALAMEEPDSSIEGRFWICDFALKLNGGRPQFAIRVSFRQPHNSLFQPDPRAPRFLRDVVDQVGATDFWELESKASLLNPDNLPFFMELLRSTTRTLPVVTISEDDRTGEIFTNPDSLARYLSGAAHVIRLDSESSWQLSKDWGKDWSTFRGAIRCYNPRLSLDGDYRKHRLWLPETVQRMDANAKDGFINVCTGHVFTQVTAQFETLPLLTPATIRRQLEETLRSISLPAILPSKEAPTLEYSDDGAAPQTALSGGVEYLQLEQSLADLRDELEGSNGTNADLTFRLNQQEDQTRALEDALQQERAGRAEVEQRHSETKADLELFEKEVQSLEEQKRIALGDIASERSEALKPLWQNFNGFFNSLQNVASQFRRFEQDSQRAEELEDKLSAANQTANNLKATVESLSRRQSYPDGIGTDSNDLERSKLVSLLPQLAQKNPSLKCSLEIVALVFPDRIVILDSAVESAARSDTFKHGEQAFELLWILSTTYWEDLQNGNGDTEARKGFGNAFAAQESVKLSKPGKSRRTFDYKGTPILMEKHLKIGTADNAADTLRIHFEWVAEEARIVVGYCGKHLDF